MIHVGLWFLAGYLAARLNDVLEEHTNLVRKRSEIRWWHPFFSKRIRFYLRRERKALPDGTRVRLLMSYGANKSDDGVWVTSWSARSNIDDPDDYRLTRGRESTYARRGQLKVVR